MRAANKSSRANRRPFVCSVSAAGTAGLYDLRRSESQNEECQGRLQLKRSRGLTRSGHMRAFSCGPSPLLSTHLATPSKAPGRNSVDLLNDRAIRRVDEIEAAIAAVISIAAHRRHFAIDLVREFGDLHACGQPLADGHRSLSL